MKTDYLSLGVELEQWQELASVYVLAESAGFARESLSLYRNAAQDSSVEQEFLRAAMLAVAGLLGQRLVGTSDAAALPDNIALWHRQGDCRAGSGLAIRLQDAPLDTRITGELKDNMLRPARFLQPKEGLRHIPIGFDAERHLLIRLGERPDEVAVLAELQRVRLPAHDRAAGPLFIFLGNAAGRSAGQDAERGNALIAFRVEDAEANARLAGLNLLRRRIARFHGVCLRLWLVGVGGFFGGRLRSRGSPGSGGPARAGSSRPAAAIGRAALSTTMVRPSSRGSMKRRRTPSASTRMNEGEAAMRRP